MAVLNATLERQRVANLPDLIERIRELGMKHDDPRWMECYIAIVEPKLLDGPNPFRALGGETGKAKSGKNHA